jgi:F420-dependent oxidoreductase-like protein
VRIKLGIHFSNFATRGGPAELAEVLAATARAAEAGGASVFTVMDHWFQFEDLGAVDDPMLDAYTTLGFLAGQTRTIALGALVTGVTYRHPGLLAKMVATLDVLSGGRAMLGIGAAWYEREHLGLGVPFPSRSERYERLEETLQICRQMWSDDNGPYSGRHYVLGETLCSPQPLQTSGPKILIGGMGERKTLRLVARYGDACNLYAFDLAVVAHKLEVLVRHCDAQGRDIATIQKTIIVGLDALDDVDAFLGSMEHYARLGIDLVWVNPVGADPAEWTARITSQVVASLAQLSAP